MSNSTTGISEEEFSDLIKNGPLSAIDMIVRDQEGRVLVGMRKNEPAKGFLFVPGGRIRKNETQDEAFKRISKNELGVELFRENAKLIGNYDHIYPNNFFNNDFGTHYVTAGWEIVLENNIDTTVFADQHEEAKWLMVEELLADPLVHDNTKNYFRTPSRVAN